MLNPSTADHEKNDPTIERCERRARQMGFGSLIVWNLFAFRATNPKRLTQVADPIGAENDAFIKEAMIEVKDRGGTILIGWGTHGKLLDRNCAVVELASSFEIVLHCLGSTNCGQPRHPLYIPYSRIPTVWSG